MSQQHRKAPAAATTAASQKPALAHPGMRVRKKKITHLGTTLQLQQQHRALREFDCDTAGDGAVMPTQTPVRAEEMSAQAQQQSLRSTWIQHQEVVQI